MMWTVLFVFGLALCVVAGVLAWGLRQRHLERWLLPYLAHAPRRRAPGSREEVHVLLCIADHYEPNYRAPSPEVARARVRRWVEDYPRNLGGFVDSDGPPPRHAHVRRSTPRTLRRPPSAPGGPPPRAGAGGGGRGPPPAGSRMLGKGPLLSDGARRKGGLSPPREKGCLQGRHPPSLGRLLLW